MYLLDQSPGRFVFERNLASLGPGVHKHTGDMLIFNPRWISRQERRWSRWRPVYLWLWEARPLFSMTVRNVQSHAFSIRL